MLDKALFGLPLLELAVALEAEGAAEESSDEAGGGAFVTSMVPLVRQGKPSGLGSKRAWGLACALRSVHEVVKDPCNRGHELLAADILVEATRRLSVQAPSQVGLRAMLPIVALLHMHGGVTLVDQTCGNADFFRVEAWLDNWLAMHPLVGAYLDPPCLYFEDVGARAPAGVAAALASIPVGGAGFGGLGAAPVPLSGGFAFPPSSQIWSFASSEDASAAALAVRVQGVARPGAGAANTVRITKFGTAGAAGFLFF